MIKENKAPSEWAGKVLLAAMRRDERPWCRSVAPPLCHRHSSVDLLLFSVCFWMYILLTTNSRFGCIKLRESVGIRTSSPCVVGRHSTTLPLNHLVVKSEKTCQYFTWTRQLNVSSVGHVVRRMGCPFELFSYYLILHFTVRSYSTRFVFYSCAAIWCLNT